MKVKIEKESLINNLKKRKLEMILYNYNTDVIDILKKYNTEIKLLDTKKITNSKVNGIFFMKNNKAYIYIDIDNVKFNRLKYVLSHEIGHMIDTYLGYKFFPNININDYNCKLSLLDKEINETIEKESEFEIFNEKGNKLMYTYDITEEFANGFAEIMCNTRNSNLVETKQLICNRFIEIKNKDKIILENELLI